MEAESINTRTENQKTKRRRVFHPVEIEHNSIDQEKSRSKRRNILKQQSEGKTLSIIKIMRTRTRLVAK